LNREVAWNINPSALKQPLEVLIFIFLAMAAGAIWIQLLNYILRPSLLVQNFEKLLEAEQLDDTL
jgi:hypothetical protein